MMRPIVIDKNVFQGWPKDTWPKGWHFVIPDRLFYEIRTDTERDLTKKFINTLRHAPNSFSIGSSPNKLIDMESKPRKVLSDNSHIDRELTRAVREEMHRPDEELIQYLNSSQLRDQCRDIQEKDRDLIRRCDATARETIIQESALQRQYDSGNAIGYDDIVALVQKPDALSPFIQNNLRHSHKAWRKRLLVFPDTKAIGRWWRLQLYLYLLGLKNRSPEKFENDMSDVYYAHLASYVGAIATNDKGLRDMIAALFKHVDVLENL